MDKVLFINIILLSTLSGIVGYWYGCRVTGEKLWDILQRGGMFKQVTTIRPSVGDDSSDDQQKH